MLSYLIPVPFALFVEELVGPGWNNTIRRLWQIFLAYRLAAAADLRLDGRSGGFEDDLTLIVLGRREAAAP